VFSQTGRPHSHLITEQKSAEGAGPMGGPLRFDRSLVIWVQCDQAVLDERCNRRVDAMMERGMIRELEDFHREYNSKRSHPADYTVGIFQSIGFKEFHSYLILTEEEKSTAEGRVLLERGLEQLKLVTRQYSRRQLKWLRHRFLCGERESPRVYAVDSTDPAKWRENCYQPAVEIVEVWQQQQQNL
jgi:tRNA dimethylallyltransferase